MDPAAAMATQVMEPNKQHTLDSTLELLQGWDFPQAPRALLERGGCSCQTPQRACSTADPVAS